MVYAVRNRQLFHEGISPLPFVYEQVIGHTGNGSAYQISQCLGPYTNTAHFFGKFCFRVDLVWSPVPNIPIRCVVWSQSNHNHQKLEAKLLVS